MVCSRGLVLLCHCQKGLQIGALLYNCQNPAIFYAGKSDTASLGDTGDVPGQIGLIDQLDCKTY